MITGSRSIPRPSRSCCFAFFLRKYIHKDVCNTIDRFINLITNLFCIEVAELFQFVVNNLDGEGMNTSSDVGVVPFHMPGRTLEYLVRPVKTIKCNNLSIVRKKNLAEIVLIFNRFTRLILNRRGENISLTLATKGENTLN